MRQQERDLIWSERLAEQRAYDMRRFGLLAACVFLALVAGYVGSRAAESLSTATVALNLSLAFVAFIAAAAVLRTLDAVAIRRRVSYRTARSELVSKEIRDRLEALYPGIGDRVSDEYAASVLSNALKKEETIRPHRDWNAPV